MLPYDFRTSLLLGILIGIGTSIKTYGIYGITLIALFWFKAALKSPAVILMKILGFLMIVSVLTIVTVYLLNPVFWFSPRAFLTWIPEWQAFQHWLQAGDWAYKDIALWTPETRLQVILREFIYPGGWNTRLGIWWMTVASLIVGIITSLRMENQTQKISNGQIAFIWFAVFALLLLAYTPFYIERYFLTLLPPLLLLEAVGIIQLLEFTRKFITPKSYTKSQVRR